MVMNSFTTTQSHKTIHGWRQSALRAIILAFLLPVALVATANVGGHATHYGKAVLQNATGNGTVYLSTAANENTGQTGSSNPGSKDGTSYITWNCGGSSGSDSKTYYARGTANNGYYYAGWATSSTTTSYTAYTTGKSFSASSETSGSPTTTTIYGFFKEITIDAGSASPSHIDAENNSTSCADYTGAITFSTKGDAENDFKTPTFANTGNGTFSMESWSVATDGTVTVNYKFVGDGTYGGSSGARSRSTTGVLTLTSAIGNNSSSCTVTASFPNITIDDGSFNHMTTINTVPKSATATFPVEWVDDKDDFTASFGTITGGGEWTINEPLRYNATDGTISIDYTFNPKGAIGEHSAVLTLSANANAGGASKTLTLTAETEALAEYDASIGDTKYSTLAAAIAAANTLNTNPTVKVLRNVEGLTSTITITKPVTIDLNSFTISGTLSSSVNKLFYLNSTTAALTITDSRNGGKIAATGNNNAILYTILVDNGSLLLNKGDIEMHNTNTGSTAKANAVRIKAGARFAMTGGNLIATTAGSYAYGLFVTTNPSDANMIAVSGGTITAAAANTLGIGIYCQSSSSTAATNPENANVVLSGVTVDASTTGSTDAYAVQTDAGVILAINSGTYNATTATQNAYALVSNGYTAILGGTFNATATTLLAHGLRVMGGITAMRAGSVTATAATEQAHGAYVGANAKLLTYGGTIRGYLSNAAAGKWATGAQIVNGGTLEAQGGTFIGEVAKTGLAAAQKDYAVGVYANTGSTVTIANATLRGILASTFLTNGGAEDWAGGAYGIYSKTTNRLSLTNCTIAAQSEYQGGFGIRLLNTPAEIKNCTVTVNTVKAYNYGLFTQGATNAEVANSTFTNNSGTTRAYGAYVHGGNVSATNTTFDVTTNQTGATSVAACNLHGIKVNTGTNATLTGCTITASGNSSYGQDAYGLYVDGSADVTDCEISVSNIKTNAYAIFNSSNTGLVNVYSGKFKATATSGTIVETNATAAAAKQQLTGGYYVHNTNLAKYMPEGYMVETLTTGDEFNAGYKYHIRPTTVVNDPVCKIGSTGYATLEEAFDYVNKNTGTTCTILMVKDYTLPAGNYTLPANATLLVPKNGQTALEEHPTRVAKGTAWAAPSCYKKLTFATGVQLVVWGKIQTGGVQAAVNQMPGHNGVPRDTYGHIVLDANSKITLENGAHLYSWGYVTGDGTIDAKRGSTVHECLQVRDWRGGTCTSNMKDNDKGVFPLNQYAIQNIEAMITFHPGSQEKCDGTVNARAGIFDGTMTAYTFEDVNLIGITGSSSLFMMNNEDNSADTWVRKYYDVTNDMQVYELNSSAQLGSLVLSLYGINFDSYNYVLPITNNMHIHLLTGSMHITQNTEILPGAIIEIDKEATAYVDAGKSLYIFDADEWDKFGSGTSYFYLLAYSATLGKAPTKRSESTKPSDAALNIHGKLQVDGYLFTTASGANIYSTNEDAGTISFTNTVSASDITVYVANNTTTTYNAKTANPALLKNGDGTYAETSGTAAGKSWIYYNNQWNCWEERDCFGYDAQDHPYAKPAAYVQLTSNVADATDHLFRDQATENRRFLLDNCVWWEVEPTPYNGNKYKCVTPDHNGKYKYYEYLNNAWQEATVTVNWNINGTNTAYSVLYGTTPKYLDATPTKTSTATDYYTWLGWTQGSTEGDFYTKEDDLPVATENTTYYAYFKADKFTFRAYFNNYDGALLESKLVATGEIPMYEGATPTKPASTSTEYTFSGWSPTIAAITNAQVTYTAQFSESTRNYTIQWVNYDGTILKEEQVAYGSTPTAPVTPTRPNDDYFTYNFANWSPAIASVAGNQTYTATYNYAQKVNKYTATFKNGNETIYTQYLVENSVPAFDGSTPTKDATAQYTYSFDGWSTTIGGERAYAANATLPALTSNVIYYAHFAATTNTYTVLWKSEDGKVLYETDQNVEYNTTPQCSIIPTKDRVGSTIYSFVGWSATIGGERLVSLPKVTENKTFYAHFSDTPLYYTITWKNGNEAIETDTNVEYGTMPAYNGTTPSKAADDQYYYTFTGWTPAIIPATEDATYTATFSANLITNIEITSDETEDIPTPIVVNNFTINATSTESGQILNPEDLTIVQNAYFDLTLNAQLRTWYAVAVPWQVEAETGVFGDGNHLTLGRDYDIIWYDGATRAANGPVPDCWKYIEDIPNAADRIILPGRLYMMYFARQYTTIRFVKKSDADIVFDGTVEVQPYTASNSADANWNGIANPMLYHVHLNAGVSIGQRYVSDIIGQDHWEPIIDLTDQTFIVGQPILLQAQSAQAVTFTQPAAAPARKADDASLTLSLTIGRDGENTTDKLILRANEDATDNYEIGHDLAKVAVSNKVAQLWVPRYNAKLCVNEASPVNGTTTYPLAIYAPAAGDYELTVTNVPNDAIVYLTQNGNIIANITYAPYIMPLSTGTTTEYGIMLITDPVGVATATIQTNNTSVNVDKMIYQHKLYIIREGHVYNAQGQKIK